MLAFPLVFHSIYTTFDLKVEDTFVRKKKYIFFYFVNYSLIRTFAAFYAASLLTLGIDASIIALA